MLFFEKLLFLAKKNKSKLKERVVSLKKLSVPEDGDEDVNWQKPVFYGFIVVFIFVFGFGVWAGFAPLNSAIIAPGTVIVEKKRQVIQHLTGGLLEEILVEEGSFVKQGQVLLRLNTLQSDASLQTVLSQYYSALAQESRLIAERDGHEKLTFPLDLLKHKDNPKIIEVMASELNAFNGHRKTGLDKMSLMDQRILQIRKEIQALKIRIKSEKEQLRLINEETKGVQVLVDEGLERKSRLLALQRQKANIEGSIGQNKAMVAKAEQSIGEARLQILLIKDEKRKVIVDELKQIQDQLSALREKLRSATDIVQRSEIRASITGTVVSLKVNTIGGVVQGGAPLMEIVPEDEKLVIEAKIKPIDIDVVHVGEMASVRLTAFNRRTTPLLDGMLTKVSADVITDPRFGLYYIGVVEIDGEELREYKDLSLLPGMPADVMIVTRERTALEAVLGPLWIVFERAFRED
ncbi:MAG: HlyD family type I secretion periplasmic adaptor subunit [Alphaproteobacteria bacterium]